MSTSHDASLNNFELEKKEEQAIAKDTTKKWFLSNWNKVYKYCFTLYIIFLQSIQYHYGK